MPYISRTTVKFVDSPANMKVKTNDRGLKSFATPVEMQTVYSGKATTFRVFAFFSDRDAEYVHKTITERAPEDRYLTVSGIVYKKSKSAGGDTKYDALQVQSVETLQTSGVNVSRSAFIITNDELKPEIRDGVMSLNLKLEDDTRIYKEKAGYYMYATVYGKQAELVVKYLKDRETKRVLLSGHWYKKPNADGSKSYHTLLVKDLEFAGLRKWDSAAPSSGASSSASTPYEAPAKEETTSYEDSYQEPEYPGTDEESHDMENFEMDLDDLLKEIKTK